MTLTTKLDTIEEIHTLLHYLGDDKRELIPRNIWKNDQENKWYFMACDNIRVDVTDCKFHWDGFPMMTLQEMVDM